MTASVVLVVSRPAQDDIDEQAAYLEDRDPGAGSRFLDEVRQAFDRLIAFPDLGWPWPTTRRELVGLRRIVLPAFPVSLFYRSTAATVEVVRVLHHARDMPALLEDL